jgi:predicted dehydrogenase
MSSSPVRIGVIGCGQIAQSHLDNYSRIPDAKVIALCDIKESALVGSAKKFGVSSENCYEKFRDLLKRPDIDAVDICLHNNLHMPATVAGLEAGKHVYCEKPMAGAYRDAVTMLEAAKRTKRNLHIQLSTIYQSATRAAKELIEAGDLGEIYHARSTGHRRRGRPFVDGYGSDNFVQKKIAAGGALYDMGVYHISQVLYLLGNPTVQRISGKTYQKIEMDTSRKQSSGYDVEELGMGFVRCANGLSLDIIESWAANIDSFEGSYILGSKAGVRLEPFGYFSSRGDLDLNASANMAAAKNRWDNVRGDGGLYASSQEHWVAALQGKAPLLPTAEIALNTMLISEGIYLSEKLNREVTVDEVREQSVSTAVEI